MPSFTQNIARLGSPPPAPACPSPITGKSYLVCGAAGGATDDIYAFLYSDGGYDSTLAVKDCSGVLNIASNTKFLKVPGSGHVVVFASVTTGGRDCIVTWDCDANTLAVNAAQAALTGLSIALVGSTVYGNFNPGGSGGACYPITAAIGASGTNDSGFTYSLGTTGSFPKGYMMEEGGTPASPHILFAASTAVVGGFPNGADYGYWLHAPTIASDLDPVEPFRTFNYADVDHPDFVSVPIPGGSGGAIVAGNIFGGRPDRIFRIANGFMSESRLWPDHWTDGSVLGGAIVPAWVPNAAGTELVVTDSVGADYVIVRTTIADLSALDVSCPPPYIVMDAPPVGSISVAFPLN